MSILPFIVLVIAFILVACRQFLSRQISLWQIFVVAAIALLATRQISPIQAIHAINFDVIGFLFGVFVIGKALEESGALPYFMSRIAPYIHSTDRLLWLILLGAGGLSIFFMNDTLAIIGVPFILMITDKQKTLCVPLLLTLAFAVTIGSTLSPIGNPQNLIIATHDHLKNPFLTFFHYLAIPSLINLGVAFVIIKWFFKKELSKGLSTVTLPSPLVKKGLAKLTLLSSIIFIGLLLAKVVADFILHTHFLSFGVLAIIAAMPLLLGTGQRTIILKTLDWGTLLFFIGLFIVMQSVWQTGLIQYFIAHSAINLSHPSIVLVISALFSQVISNVPLVSLYLPVLYHHNADVLSIMALAAGSTIAGNLTIMGAASNVIIVEAYQKQTGEHFRFWTFLKVGAVLTILNLLVYYLYWLGVGVAS